MKKELRVAALRLERLELVIDILERELPRRRDLAAQCLHAECVRRPRDLAVARSFHERGQIDETAERIRDDPRQLARIAIEQQHLPRPVPFVELEMIAVS